MGGGISGEANHGINKGWTTSELRERIPGDVFPNWIAYHNHLPDASEKIHILGLTSHCHTYLSGGGERAKKITYVFSTLL